MATLMGSWQVTKFSNNKYIKSISDAMMALIGIMIFGSFAVIFHYSQYQVLRNFCHYRT